MSRTECDSCSTQFVTHNPTAFYFVLIISILKHWFFVFLSDYCASKAAEINFLESVAFEMWTAGKKDIKTTIVCPSFVNTGLINGIRSKYVLDF